MKNQRSEFKNVMAQAMRSNLEAPAKKAPKKKPVAPKEVDADAKKPVDDVDTYEECDRCGAKLEGEDKEYGTCSECVKE